MLEYNETRLRHEGTESPTLDALALALATGHEGNAFAVALDCGPELRLVLAKRGAVNEADRAAAQELCALVATATSWEHEILPYLVRRCSLNLNRAVEALRESITDAALQDDIEHVLQTYSPDADLSVEFAGPTGPHFLAHSNSGGDRTYAALLQDALRGVVRSIPADTSSSSPIAIYRDIIAAADLLRRTRILETISEDRNWNHLRCPKRERLRKLHRRLGIMCFYRSGFTDAIDTARRYFPNATAIPHVWLRDNLFQAEDLDLELSSPPDLHAALSQILDGSASETLLRDIGAKFPGAAAHWKRQPRTVPVCVHPEIRIMLYLYTALPPNDDPIHAPRQYIGVSEACCLCCKLWGETCNRTLRTSFRLSFSRGRPYDATWAFPSLASSEPAFRECSSAIDEAVWRRAGGMLRDVLARKVREAGQGTKVDETEIGKSGGPSLLGMVMVANKDKVGHEVAEVSEN